MYGTFYLQVKYKLQYLQYLLPNAIVRSTNYYIDISSGSVYHLFDTNFRILKLILTLGNVVENFV